MRDALVKYQAGCDIRKIIFRDQSWHVEFHLCARIQGLVDIRNVASAQGCDGTLEHAEIERKTDLIDLPGLLGTQEFTRAANFHIV